MSETALPAAPVSLAERITFIDVLRGMALFGIVTANMRAFAAPIAAYGDIQLLFPSRADVAAQFLVDAVFQGKFVSIFSFLFGLGFAMQMTRAAARGTRFLGFYPRRLLALGLFGLLHGALIWAGDILLTYSIAGAILLTLRNRSQKALLRIAFSIMSLPVLISTVFVGLYYSPWRPAWMKAEPPDLAKFHHTIDIYAHGTLWQITLQRLADFQADLRSNLFAFYASALFMLGMWVWRQGIVQNLPEYAPVFRRVAAWAIPVGLIVNVYVTTLNIVLPHGRISLAGWSAGVLWLPGAHLLAAGYMAALALLFLHPVWQRLLHPFAAVGQMALTNYLAQSVIFTTYFYHTGSGLYGTVGPAACLAYGAGLYFLQVVFSNIWLRFFRFGPMEWVWRGMTYGTLPPLRRA